MQELTTIFFRARDENAPLERDKLQEKSVTKDREEWTVLGANPILVLTHRLLDIRSLSLLTW